MRYKLIQFTIINEAFYFNEAYKHEPEIFYQHYFIDIQRTNF